MRAFFLVALVGCSAVLGCSPTLRDGVYGCATPNECPAGFTCVGGVCRTMTGSECRYDFNCDTPCATGRCENGFCEIENTLPDGEFCDDRRFCNGVDTCVAGACTPSGVAPCPECTEELFCGALCGGIDETCCDGVCTVGDCVDGVCTACGDMEGGPCCLNRRCQPGFLCGAEGTCRACGLPSQPCCGGGIAPEGGPAILDCQPPSVCAMDGFCTADCGTPGRVCCMDGCRQGFCDLMGFLCQMGECGTDAVCPGGTICGPSGVCEPCGGLGQLCCTDGPPCRDTLSCDWTGRCDLSVMRL